MLMFDNCLETLTNYVNHGNINKQKISISIYILAEYKYLNEMND